MKAGGLDLVGSGHVYLPSDSVYSINYRFRENDDEQHFQTKPQRAITSNKSLNIFCNVL